MLNTFGTIQGKIFYSSSVCKLPFYEVDFGWGKPVEVLVRIPDVDDYSMLLLDTPSGDGIVANVHLPEEEMAVLKKDE